MTFDAAAGFASVETADVESVDDLAAALAMELSNTESNDRSATDVSPARSPTAAFAEAGDCVAGAVFCEDALMAGVFVVGASPVVCEVDVPGDRIVDCGVTAVAPAKLTFVADVDCAAADGLAATMATCLLEEFALVAFWADTEFVTAFAVAAFAVETLTEFV